MSKINIHKSLSRTVLFLLVLILSLNSLFLYAPKTAEAAMLTGDEIKVLANTGEVPGKTLTKAQKEAKSNADQFCEDYWGDSDTRLQACRTIYIAGYLGEENPEPDPGNLRDSEVAEFTVAGINKRTSTYKQIPKRLCEIMVNTAQGGDKLGSAFKNLKDKDKNKAMRACETGFRDGLSDFGSGCQNRFGSISNKIQLVSCLHGMVMADQHIFVGGEVVEYAGGTVNPDAEDDEGGGGGGGEGEGQGTEEIKCEASAPTISWFICPVIEFGANFTNWFFNSFLRPLLEDVPVSLDPSEGSFQAWQGFRLLANIMLVASMLAIVYAQARGDQ